jgi:hypothetical protein
MELCLTNRVDRTRRVTQKQVKMNLITKITIIAIVTIKNYFQCLTDPVSKPVLTAVLKLVLTSLVLIYADSYKHNN